MLTLLQAEPPARVRMSSSVVVLQRRPTIEVSNVISWENGILSYFVTNHVNVVAFGSRKLLPVIDV